MASHPKLIAIVGPTASGKSELAFALAEKFNGEIVNADARQIYRGFNIGTGKDVGLGVHLIDIADARETMTVAEYQRRAFEAIDGIVARGRLPILVGGTGLYVSSVIDGREFPDVPPHPRFRFVVGLLPVILQKFLLRILDGKAAERVDLKNPRRVLRALEIALFSVKRLNRGRDLSVRGHLRDYDVMRLGIAIQKDELARRINRRVDEMVKGGLFDEVKKLLDSGVSTKLPAMSGIGYKEITAHFRGELSREEAGELIKKNTRAYAKRQMPWFRRDEKIKWVENTEQAERHSSQFVNKQF